MSNPSFPLVVSSLPCATSPSGRPPDLPIVWPALPSIGEGSPSGLGVGHGVGIVGDGSQGVERLDGDGLHDMEVSLPSGVIVPGQGVVNGSGGTEGQKEGSRKATFKDMVMGKVCGGEEVDHASLDRQSGREQLDTGVYGPWMQAPSRRRRIVQSRKATGDKGLSIGGDKGSRFAMLNVNDGGNDSVADVVAAQLSEVVINAGPSASVKGKMVGNVGVGSSKGGALRRVDCSTLVQEPVSELDTLISGLNGVRKPSSKSKGTHEEMMDNRLENVQVASTGVVRRARSSLSLTSHAAVYVLDGGRDEVVTELDEPSFFNPIRKVAAKGAHRFNPESSFRQRRQMVKKSVKRGPGLESAAQNLRSPLGEVECLASPKELQELGQHGLPVVVSSSPHEHGADMGELMRELTKQV
ncbi:hypothetical protein V6N13_148585 [Hibiscus sabdariffa]